MTQWITRLSSVQEDPGSNSTIGMIFFILKFSLVSRAAQHDNAIANEINHGTHLANTLFSLENYMYLLDHLRFKHEIAMSRVERSVCYFLSRLPNLKLTAHYATLRSQAKAYITRLNCYSLSTHLLKNAAWALL